jgi:hypothetical protein
VKEYEIRELFLKISNFYNNFLYDDYKVELWRETLDDIPYHLANSNLLRYIRNPENKFPPHPGALSESAVQSSNGPYVLNAEETRLMLDDGDHDYNQTAVKLPEHIRERVKHLGLPLPTIAGTDGSEPSS